MRLKKSCTNWSNLPISLPPRNVFKFRPPNEAFLNSDKINSAYFFPDSLLSIHVLHDYGCAKSGLKMKQTFHVALECRFCPQCGVSGPAPQSGPSPGGGGGADGSRVGEGSGTSAGHLRKSFTPRRCMAIWEVPNAAPFQQNIEKLP